MSSLTDRVVKVYDDHEEGTLDLVFALEEEFDIEIPDADMGKVDTVFNAIRYLKGRGVQE